MYPVKIDVAYSAKATNSEHTFDEASTYNISALIIASQVLIPVLSVAIIAILVILFTKSKQDHWAKKIEAKKPLICSIAVISTFITLHNFILSCCSVHYWNKYTDDPLYKYDRPRNEGPVIFILMVDLLSLLFFSLSIAIISCMQYMKEEIPLLAEFFAQHLCKFCSANSTHCSYTSFPWYVVLSAMILGPIISYIAHSPYIVIAYLNDGHHASSIFIYYTVVIYIAYTICWIGFHPHSFLQPRSERQQTDVNKCSIWTTFISGLLVFALFLGLVVTTTVYFVLIPINKSISDAPDRLAGIYQSGGFIIASFVLYKLIAFFYSTSKKLSLEQAILDRKDPLVQNDTNWVNKSGDDKLKEFYEVVVSIISQKYNTSNSGSNSGISIQ